MRYCRPSVLATRGRVLSQRLNKKGTENLVVFSPFLQRG
jgi:hypothetical protein